MQFTGPKFATCVLYMHNIWDEAHTGLAADCVAMLPSAEQSFMWFSCVLGLASSSGCFGQRGTCIIHAGF